MTAPKSRKVEEVEINQYNPVNTHPEQKTFTTGEIDKGLYYRAGYKSFQYMIGLK